MSADLVIRNGWVVTPQRTFKGGVAIEAEKIVTVGPDDTLPHGKKELDVKGNHILPGLIDGHVHFREPGLTHKEDFGSGSTAAVCGGVVMVVDMPNTVPPVTGPDQVREKQRLAEQKSLVDFGITGVVINSNVDQIPTMARAGALGFKIFFGETTGNLPCPDDGLCTEIFPLITNSNLPLCIHAENREIMAHCTGRLKAEGKNDPVYWESSRPEICETASVALALCFAEAFGTRLHVLHMSSKEAARMIKDAKARGVKVTCETTPQHLLRDAAEMEKFGPLLKINPPVRSREHGDALWEALLDGTVDMIATDHSPHTLEEKGCDPLGRLVKPTIWDCVSGFCGVETGPSLILTEVNKGKMTLNQYVRLASENPAKVWQLYPKKGALQPGADGDVTIVDMDKETVIDAGKLHSKTKPSPWHGWKVKGVPVGTIVRGHIQMLHGEVTGKPIGRLVTPFPIS